MASTALVGRSFSERLVDFLDVIEYRPIGEGEDREAVFRLRYDAYVREGAIPISFARRFTDRFDDMPNARIFGLYIEGELASSIRVHIASPEHPDAPCMMAFSDVLGPEIAAGRSMVDPSRFVADQTWARRHSELPYATVRLGFLATEYFNADLGLATPRAEHQAFYKRLFGLRLLCEPREYPSLTKPLSLMGIHYPTVRESLMERHPFLRATGSELEALFGGMPSVPVVPSVPLVPQPEIFETAGQS